MMSVPLGDFARQHGADGAIDIADRRVDLHRLALRQSRHRRLDQLAIQHMLQSVILLFAIEGRHARLRLLQIEQL